jgi:phosphoribosylformylglycinamidine cyclo-ligase
LDREAAMKRLNYKKAGVDIDKAKSFKKKIKALTQKSSPTGVLKGIGGFGGLFNFPKDKYKYPVLVSSSDGVGTKLKIATLVNRHDSVGIDLVAMNVNDILCVGAEPLFFLDYISCSKLRPEVMVEVVKSVNKGCIQAGCSLIGGETAQMPGMYKDNEYDLAGFCVGVVEKNNIIDGSRIQKGDVVLGLESSGIHSNGYSLVRKVFSQKELKRMSKELLKPTRIYVKPVLSLLPNNNLSGIAHITGGAFYDKIARILPDNLDARIDKNSWIVPKVFRLIQNKGRILDKDMYHTFNMGIGMVLIVKPAYVTKVAWRLSAFKLKSRIIGEIVKGSKTVYIV